jgi:DMSO reductase family type II enzyme heme b subunit
MRAQVVRSAPGRFAFLMGFGFSFLGAATSLAGTPERISPEARAELLRGAEIFSKQCAVCHGDKGDGQGKFAYLMDPRPRDLLAGRFKITTTENLIPSDEDLLRTLRRGMPGSAMPPWGHLPEADLHALVSYVRALHHEGVSGEVQSAVASGMLPESEAPAIIEQRTRPGETLRIPPEPGFDSTRWFRGRSIYLQACASCHGLDGHPVTEAVKTDEDGYPVPPRSFVAGIYKGGGEGHQIYARVLKGMRGTPMPGYDDAYSSDEMWDLIRYVQSLAREGAQERAQLRQESIVAPKVAQLPASPGDEATWNRARPVYVGLTPLWWIDDRIEGLLVQALHDGNELAFRLSWIDPTLDDLAVRTEDFRDAVAIQFSLSSDPPFYMGTPGEHGGVNMWMWKADRQRNLAEGYRDIDTAYPDLVVDMYPEQEYTTIDKPQGEEWSIGPIDTHHKEFITAWGAGNLVARPDLESPVESLTASGPGTLSSLPFALQQVAGSAVYERGVWKVQVSRALLVGGDEGVERPFRSGDYIPVSFAVFDGDARDRDGKKNISIWQRLVIE